ncbi:MAG: hypothetical protein JW703_02655 [Candidatus Diapherotrites archaeon]|nr:hypothetical protein [Candidatus Diapherotrites archaeon]
MNEEKRPLKHFLSGLEFEFFLIDSKGRMKFNSDAVIKKANEIDSNASVVKECAKNMIELNAYPKQEPEQTIHQILQGMKVLITATEKNDSKLCSLACYPGSFEPKMRTETFYKAKEKIFGEEKFKIAGRAIGTHFHYTMPKGVFDKDKLVLKKLINSKLANSMMNAYNFLIAIDPALSTIMANSPFYESENLGKDSRVFVYRGGKKLHYPKGLYSKFLSIGGLPPYKQTLADLKYSIYRRKLLWKKALKKAGENPELVEQYKTYYDIGWNPVKVNKHDTLEQRGMDMNYLDNTMGIVSILNYLLFNIQNDFIQVIPSDIGLEEPFKLEGNLLFIPPHTHLRNKLQFRAAKFGFNSKSSKDYTKRFMNLAMKFVPKEQKEIIAPVKEIALNEESESDKILKLAKKLGWKENTLLEKEIAEKLALHSAEETIKRLKKTEKILEEFV